MENVKKAAVHEMENVKKAAVHEMENVKKGGRPRNGKLHDQVENIDTAAWMRRSLQQRR